MIINTIEKDPWGLVWEERDPVGDNKATRRQEQQTLRWLTLKLKIEKKKSVSFVSSAHTSYTMHTVLDLLNVCSNHTMFKLQWQEFEEEKKQKTKNRSEICGSDTPLTLYKGQGHQTWYAHRPA